MNNEILISFAGVNKTYHRGSEDVHAVVNASFQIKRGEFVGIIGPSGSGKTTLLNIMGCMDLPSSGQVTINGTAINGLKEKDLVHIRRKTFGFVFQQFFLIPTLTVLQNVQLPALFARTDADEKKARDILRVVGLEKRLAHLPNQLSGGEMQRVAIARSLINDPQILLADEPTGNLDSRNAENIMKIFATLNQNGLTIVVVTHNSELVRRCSKEVHIEDGRLKE